MNIPEDTEGRIQRCTSHVGEYIGEHRGLVYRNCGKIEAAHDPAFDAHTFSTEPHCLDCHEAKSEAGVTGICAAWHEPRATVATEEDKQLTCAYDHSGVLCTKCGFYNDAAAKAQRYEACMKAYFANEKCEEGDSIAFTEGFEAGYAYAHMASGYLSQHPGFAEVSDFPATCYRFTEAIDERETQQAQSEGAAPICKQRQDKPRRLVGIGSLMAATCEKSEIGTETVADLLSQLRDFEDRYGVSTTVIMKQFEENPDSIDYAKIDFNSWYTLYLTMCEVVATDDGLSALLPCLGNPEIQR